MSAELRVLPPNTVCACLDETGERKVRQYDQCQRCGAFMESEPPATGLDVERLWEVIKGMGVLDNGTWVSFRRQDAENIAAEYVLRVVAARLTGAAEQ